MSSLKVALLQFNIAWKDKDANFKRIEELVAKTESDLVVLPEMFQTGFCVDDPSIAESEAGETTKFLSELSKKKKCAVAGSFLYKEDGNIYNRLAMFKEGDLVGYYDKVHLFGLGNENEFLSSGQVKADFMLNGFKIRPIICYDLRFPYSAFNDSDYDILLCCANWPSNRIDHWDLLLKARAIENQAFVVACNRVGEQPGHNELTYYYPGHSAIYNAQGKEMIKSHKEEILEYTLDKQDLEQVRSELPFIKDRKM